ncbi:MAG: precorrin-6Y C5,15-methyltransferase (decarboxylating) subunit CbiT, partial [Pikeienuella sp.]
GRRVAVLASGDPFLHGAGAAIAQALAPGEWRALPGPSALALAAARLGWAEEDTTRIALHAAPFGRLRPHLAPGARILALLRDGEAPTALAAHLAGLGFGATRMVVMEALGGPRERIREARAEKFKISGIAHPVLAALEVRGMGPALPAAGRPDEFFGHDGQITKQPVRALTLSALAPRPGERLWDIGAGSGSISIEWLLAHPANSAIAVEADPARAARIRENAGRLGADRLFVFEGRAPSALVGKAPPDAVFIGGGLSAAMLEKIWPLMPESARLVANAVTLESEALLAAQHAARGGALLRIELSDAAPLGGKRGWSPRRPITQWSVTK